jgi:tetratricopeptide (TPR) repeat protein
MTTNIIYVAFGGGGAKNGPDAPSEPDREAKATRRERPVSRADRGSGFHLQGEHRSLVDLYTRRQVSQLIGVSEGKLRWWEKCGLVRPSRRYGREKFYSFENLIAVKAAKELTDRGCRATQIKAAIRKLVAQLPDAEKPLTKMKVVGNDRRLVIEREGRDVEVGSGQVLIDFTVSSVVTRIQESVTAGAAGRRTGGDRSAYEWFLEGVGVEDSGEPDAAARAEEAYRKAIEIDPGLAPATTNLGNLMFRQGKMKEAEAYYRKAIRDDPYLPQPYYNLGCLKLNEGRADIALVYLKKAQDLDPEFTDVYFHLALALEQEGRKEEALDCFNKFLALEDDSSWSQIARQHVELLK